MSKRAASRLAWSNLALAIVFSFASLLLWSVNDRSQLLQQVLFTPAFLAFPTIGALVVSRRPENPIGWIFCAVSLVVFGLFAQQYAWYTLLTNPGSLPGGVWMAWVGRWVGIIGFYLPFSLPLLLFPDGRPPSHRWRPLVWLTIAFLSMSSIFLGLKPGPMEMQNIVLPMHNPVGIEALAGLYGLLEAVQNITLIPVFLGCALAPIVRFRRARGDERQQLKWVAYAAIGFFINILIPDSISSLLGPDISTLLFSLTIASFPVAVGIAILKYRLYDIDVIIRRTLVYGSLTVSLAAVYFGSVVLLEAVLQPLTGQHNDLVIVISTLLIAGLFLPLRGTIQRLIDRRFYRRSYNATRTLEAFSATLRDEVDLDALESRLVEVVHETMQPAHVSLWLREPSRTETLTAQR
jgi:hypothetical protein